MSVLIEVVPGENGVSYVHQASFKLTETLANPRFASVFFARKLKGSSCYQELNGQAD
ncbi:MAG: hypothetical protein LPK26_20065 [Bacillaceae bacterium]|nr:hypothetical protein [Bacillaceae bacterium]